MKKCRYIKDPIAGKVLIPECMSVVISNDIDDCICQKSPEVPIDMPKSLTAENGAKALLMGEFFETIEVLNKAYCGCGKCDHCYDFPEEPEMITQKVPVSWTTIKAIYAKIVSHFNDQNNGIR